METASHASCRVFISPDPQVPGPEPWTHNLSSSNEGPNPALHLADGKCCALDSRRGLQAAALPADHADGVPGEGGLPQVPHGGDHHLQRPLRHQGPDPQTGPDQHVPARLHLPAGGVPQRPPAGLLAGSGPRRHLPGGHQLPLRHVHPQHVRLHVREPAARLLHERHPLLLLRPAGGALPPQPPLTAVALI